MSVSFKVTEEWLKPYIKKDALWCTTASCNGQQLVEHIYYGDGNCIWLWYAAPLFCACDHYLRDLIGYVNCFLPWKDRQYFKECGFEIYD